jgi:hypothetical protein
MDHVHLIPYLSNFSTHSSSGENFQVVTFIFLNLDHCWLIALLKFRYASIKISNALF